MKKEEFIFCPLGGSGEIGMNMNLFAYGNSEDRKWIIVDIGVTFADDTVPGIDLIYPDPGFFVSKNLMEYITEAGSIDDSENLSDHTPIYFKVKIIGIK